MCAKVFNPGILLAYMKNVSALIFSLIGFLFGLFLAALFAIPESIYRLGSPVFLIVLPLILFAIFGVFVFFYGKFPKKNRTLNAILFFIISFISYIFWVAQFAFIFHY